MPRDEKGGGGRGCRGAADKTATVSRVCANFSRRRGGDHVHGERALKGPLSLGDRLNGRPEIIPLSIYLLYSALKESLVKKKKKKRQSALTVWAVEKKEQSCKTS